MKKHILIQIAFFFGFVICGYSQLYVSPNSYVYNKGTFIYVAQNINLQSTGNIYLRNEGHLLQGTTTAGTNTGLGSLSVFQEGTSNNFAYNYWCSPVGNATATAANSVFTPNLVINRPTGLTTSELATFTLPSVFDGTTTNTNLTISSRYIYKYSGSNSYSQWAFVGANGTVNPGLGFSMKGVSGDDATTVGETTPNNPVGLDNQRYDFRGKPNDGLISIPVHSVAGQFSNMTLTGNPYPSAINLNYFLLENSGKIINYTTGTYTTGGTVNVIDGTAYFWEHNKTINSHMLTDYVGGYGRYVPNGLNANSPGTYNSAPWATYNSVGDNIPIPGNSGIDYKRMFTPVGQGFMVKGTASGATAFMKNIYRAFVKEGIANNSVFERQASSNASTFASATSSLQNDSENWDYIPNVAGVDYTQFSKLLVPQIKFYSTLNDVSTKEITLAFNPNTTDGYDIAMDSEYSSTPPKDVYFTIEDLPYAISTLPFHIDKRVPLRFKSSESAIFSFKVGATINFDGSDEVYIYDKETNIYHDIMNGSFELVFSEEGTTADRYEITFKKANALNNTTNSYANVSIIQNNDSQLIKVSNPNKLNINEVSVFDISGKLVLNNKDLSVSSNYEVSSSSLSEGVYIVNCRTSNGEKFSEKILVERIK